MKCNCTDNMSLFTWKTWASIFKYTSWAGRFCKSRRPLFLNHLVTR